jgi:hypothetical protein
VPFLFRSAVMKPAFATLLVSIILVTLGSAQVAAGAKVHTLVSGGVMGDFVQDGDRIAWWNCRGMWIRTVSTGLMRSFQHGVCDQHRAAFSGVALAGTRVLWSVSGTEFCEHACPGDPFEWVATAALTGPSRAANIEDLSGRYVVAMAGDGPTLTYSIVRLACTNPPGEPCPSPTVVGGVVKRVVGRSARLIPHAGPAAHLAAASGRIGLVPATGEGGAAVNARVEVRNARTGELLASFVPAGHVREIALSRTAAVVLVAKENGHLRIERYAIRTGNRLGATSVSPRASELDISGGRIVYRTPRAIRLVNAVTGHTKLLRRIPAGAFGVSIEGRRVAWAVNAERRGRILAFMLPRSR